jgi:predicted permease
MNSLLHDLRYAVRSLRRSPGFTVIAVLVLALGIGATTAIFALLDSVALRPLAYPDAERLVWISSPVPGVGPDAVWGLSPAGYFHLRSENRTLDELGVYVGAFGATQSTVTGTGEPRRVDGAVVSAGIFDALRARPALGRLFGPDEDRPGAPSVAVLGHGFWEREFGGDPGVIGSIIQINEMPAEIIGVLAPGIELPDRRADLWTPHRLDPAARPVNTHYLGALGRLKAGVTAAEAERDLVRLTNQFTELFPTAYDDGFMRETGFTTRVTPLRDHVIGNIARVLWILLGAVGLVLLIACANVANLFVVRAEARRRELAVRSALGARRGQLAGHYLTEGVLLSLGAGVLGLVFADVGIRLLLALSPAGIPRLEEVGLGGAAVGFAAAVSLGAGVVFGLFPVLRSRIDLAALRDGSRNVSLSPRQHRARAGLVIGQVTLAVVLLAAAGLMLRSFQELRRVEPGFEAEGVLTLEVAIPAARYRSYEDVNRFYRTLLERVEALPGVRSAGAAQVLPLKAMGFCSIVFVEDKPLAPGEQPPCVGTHQATPGYFEALGIPVAGRAPDWLDMERAAGDVVVTKSLADRLWPGEDPIGKGIKGNGSEPPFYRVVGVTGELRGRGLDQAASEAVFFPMLPLAGTYLWSPPRAMHLVVQTQLAQPTELTAAIRRLLDEIDPAIPLGAVQTMAEVVSRSMIRTTFAMLLLGIAAGMALLLGAVGLYGVIAYVVGQREQEIGVRLALGAAGAEVARLIVGQSLRLTLAGVGAGLVVALIVTRVMRALLFEVSPTDPVTLGLVALVLVGVALLASWIPARRAARVDPMVALRAE